MPHIRLSRYPAKLMGHISGQISTQCNHINEARLGSIWNRYLVPMSYIRLARYPAKLLNRYPAKPLSCTTVHEVWQWSSWNRYPVPMPHNRLARYPAKLMNRYPEKPLSCATLHKRYERSLRRKQTNAAQVHNRLPGVTLYSVHWC